MKKSFFVFATLLVCYACSAQSNNPENQYGIDIARSKSIIETDFTAGRTTSLTQERLDYYQETLPVKGQINLQAASTIISTINDTSFRLLTYINNSSLSQTSKSIITELVSNPNNLSKSAMQALCIDKVNLLNNSFVDENENKLVLSIIATLYNNTSTPNFELRTMQHCFLLGDNNGNSTYEGTGINWECAIVMSISAAVVGYALCGPGCAIAGGIIGAVLGAIS